MSETNPDNLSQDEARKVRPLVGKVDFMPRKPDVIRGHIEEAGDCLSPTVPDSGYLRPGLIIASTRDALKSNRNMLFHDVVVMLALDFDALFSNTNLSRGEPAAGSP